MRMSKVIDYLKKARAAATFDYERKYVDEAIYGIETHEQEHSQAGAKGGTLQILCMTPCSRCDKIKPYLPDTKELCDREGVGYEYHRDNSYLLKQKKKYRGIGATPCLLYIREDGTYKTKTPSDDEIATEANWLNCIAEFIA